MKKRKNLFCHLTLGFSALLMIGGIGCSPEDAADTMKKAGESAREGADTMTKDAGKMVAAGEKLAGQLGDKAMEFLSPLKEKFGSLESLKESPAELKEAVTELIQSIETKAEGIKLPEAMTKTLTGIKEKLVALRDYLGGEIEQTKIDEYVGDIMNSVKSGLGMSDKK